MRAPEKIVLKPLFLQWVFDTLCAHLKCTEWGGAEVGGGGGVGVNHRRPAEDTGKFLTWGRGIVFEHRNKNLALNFATP